VIITNAVNARNVNRSIENQLRISQAVTDTRLSELTREVREHNNFARRMPVLEEQINSLERRVTQIERRKIDI